ncbi:hypothetical protein GFK26_20700 [Variovorax paradoxus]|uniref:SbsA Ig-like domain-containing protein n=1 Tax=Variovorax paradoxus TaxID=34073 RepID=A0A5Q0MDU4_VARPD|nr:hypothetical protein GFK26_20700 [Variovorax paradoxus]
MAIVCVATLFSACGGGGGGGGGGGAFPLFPAPAPAPAPSPAPAPEPAPAPAPDTAPLSVVAFVPTASDNVPRNTEISATLNKALLASTVTDSNVRITRSGAAVPGSLNYDAASHKVSFAPAKALDLLARYTVTAGTGLKDLAGNGLAAEKSWSFRTVDGTWEAPHQLEAATTTSGDVVTAPDGQGNTVMVWPSKPDGGFFEIRTAVQSADGGWGSVSTLSASGNYHALFPQVRFDSQGNGLVVWTQGDGAGNGVWSSRFLKGTGWQTPIQLDQAFDAGYGASLAIDADGNAFAVWGKRETQHANSDIWGARFTSAGGWQAPVRLGSSANIGTYDQAEQPQVAVDAAGNAYVLWVQRTSDAPVWVARYQIGSGWQPAVSLGAVRLGDPYAPRLAVSNSGQVMALWNSFIQQGGGQDRFDLWWSTLATPGGSWTSPALLENDDAGYALNQVLVADSAGSFHAIWQQHASPSSSDLVYRRYTPGSGWNNVTTVSTTHNAFYSNRVPSLVADRNGNLMALWGGYRSGDGEGEAGTFARRYAAGEGWRSTFRVGAAGHAPASSTSLAVQTDGTIVGSWMEPTEYSSNGPVSAARFK